MTIKPSVPNLLLYAARLDSGWSRVWPARNLPKQSPQEIFSILSSGTWDENSKIFGVPFDIIFFIVELYVKEVCLDVDNERFSVYNLSFPKILAIATVVRPRSMAKEFSGTVKEVLGTAKTMGFSVDMIDPVAVQKKIDKGEYECVACEKILL